MIDRVGLADLLRRRREALRPEDVGLPRGARRRTPGLRREEVAPLSHRSTDFYSRLERERGSQPSEQMVASVAQGLHLSLDERDHLLRLADTAAEIVTELGETLRQTPLSVALVDDSSRHTGRPAASVSAGSPTRRRGGSTRRRTTTSLPDVRLASAGPSTRSASVPTRPSATCTRRSVCSS